MIKRRTHYIQPLLFGGYEHGSFAPLDDLGYLQLRHYFIREFRTTQDKISAFGPFVARGRVLPLNVADAVNKEKGRTDNARLPSDRQAAARPSKRGESGKGARRAFPSFSSVLAKVE